MLKLYYINSDETYKINVCLDVSHLDVCHLDEST